MKISIITATFNLVNAGRQDKIKKCVRSVAELSIEHEHIIIDGGSEDGTCALLNGLCESYPNLRVYSEKDKGIYDAYNKGIRKSCGEWIYFLGSDDYLLSPDRMVEAVRCAERSNAEFVISPVKIGDRGIEPVKLSARLQCMGYSHQGVIMRKTALARLGGFDCSFPISADADLTLRAHLAAYPFCVYDGIYAYFDEAGVSSAIYGRTREDTSRSIAMRLGLSEVEFERLKIKRVLPAAKMLRYLLHNDAAIRKSARCMIGRAIFNGVGLINSDGSLRFVRR